MSGKTTLDEKTTNFLGAKMDDYNEGLLKKIFAKWRAEGKKVDKTPIVEAGVQYVAKLEGLVPDCHLIVGEVRLGLQDEEAKLRAEAGLKDDDFVNKGIMAYAIELGYLGRTKVTSSTETLIGGTS